MDSRLTAFLFLLLQDATPAGILLQKITEIDEVLARWNAAGIAPLERSIIQTASELADLIDRG